MSYTRWIGNIFAVICGASALCQTTVNLKTQSRNVDFGKAVSTKPFKMGTVLPSSCVDGEMFFKSSAAAGQNLYACSGGAWASTQAQGLVPSAAGAVEKLLSSDGVALVWRALGGDVSGAPGGVAVRALRGKTVGTIDPLDGDMLRWNATAGEWQPAAAVVDLVAGNGVRLTGTTVAVEDAVVPMYLTGAGTPGGACTAGRDTYVDTTSGGFWYCNGGGAWVQTSSVGHVHDAAQITSGVLANAVVPQAAVKQYEGALAIGASQITAGVLGLAKGGTNQSVWVAGRCVEVSVDGTRLESAAGACGVGSGGVSAPALPDASKVAMWDDFLSGDKSITSSIGTLGWQQEAIGTFSELTSELNHPGIIRLDSTTSATNNSSSMHLLRTSGFQRAELFDLTWIFRANQADGNTVVRAGLVCSASSVYNQPRPSDGIWLEKAATDTNWFWTLRASGADVQRGDSGLAVSAGAWVKLRIRRVDAATIGFTVNGGAEATTSAALSASSCTPWVVVHNGNTANSRTLDIDYFSLAVTGLVR